MMYNAIIREYQSPSGRIRVCGRVLLQDLTQVPASWRIQHRGMELEASSTNLNEFLCSSKEPLQLFRPLPPVPNGTKLVIADQGRYPDYEMVVDLETETVGSLLDKIGYLWNTPMQDQRLLFDGTPLKYHDLPLSYYGMEDGEFIEMYAERCGGGFSTVDLEGRQLNGQSGGPAKHPWAGYTIGLNLYGVCPKENCISKSVNGASKEIVFHAKYGVLRMTRDKNKLQCPACNSVESEKVDQDDTSNAGGNVGRFTPKNFLLSYGRSLFRFKKSGWDQPVKRVLMESLGLSDQFKKFDETDGSCEYDFIEVVTVGKDSSPYFCVACDYPCCEKSEYLLTCGHAYHYRCRPWSGECYVCDAKQFSSISEFLGMDGDSNINNDLGGLEFYRVESNVGSKTACILVLEEEFEQNLRKLCREEREAEAKDAEEEESDEEDEEDEEEEDEDDDENEEDDEEDEEE